VDIRGFTEPLPLLSSPTRYNGKLPAGMLNHGNTCYLNAVLQVTALLLVAGAAAAVMHACVCSWTCRGAWLVLQSWLHDAGTKIASWVAVYVVC
jgi:hypothetical protein